MLYQSLLESIRLAIPDSLYKIITKWLEDESGEFVSECDFPFSWFGKHTSFSGFAPYIYRSEQSFGTFPRYKSIYWSSFEFRRGVCIFVGGGAMVGFSESGNGTTVLMTLITDVMPEYELIVTPIIEAYRSWLDEDVE